eukprot:gnl/Hemi2/26225_TR8800_c0_g1_i1.p1 gnl/Hemi2/26225_TR8800_c0_g1~~gnl/Hemi2/26225_TR8800_c0_g1_i1.p1  ORF type:complete len:247 (+),score=27.09 gnl/Hemi2/26225_TR8800_c0_g1_i1:137-877(+)
MSVSHSSIVSHSLLSARNNPLPPTSAVSTLSIATVVSPAVVSAHVRRRDAFSKKFKRCLNALLGVDFKQTTANLEANGLLTELRRLDDVLLKVSENRESFLEYGVDNQIRIRALAPPSCLTGWAEEMELGEGPVESARDNFGADFDRYEKEHPKLAITQQLLELEAQERLAAENVDAASSSRSISSRTSSFRSSGVASSIGLGQHQRRPQTAPLSSPDSSSQTRRQPAVARNSPKTAGLASPGSRR